MTTPNKDQILHCNWQTKALTEINNFLPSKTPLRILMTSGASCPDAVVEEVIQKLAGFYGIEASLDSFLAS